MRKFLFGVVSGIILFFVIHITLVLSKVIVMHVPIYEIREWNSYDNINMDLERFIDCNEHVIFDDVKFVVAPISDGYKLMLSSDVSSSRYFEIRNAIEAFLIEKDFKPTK